MATSSPTRRSPAPLAKASGNSTDVAAPVFCEQAAVGQLLLDALGLSVPHVSRTLKQLREDDLVAIEGQRVIIKDIEALSALADFERTYLSRFQLNELLPKN